MPQVVTQLIVDASGAKLGVAEFTAAMDKAKRSAVEGGEATATAFERAQSRWTASLAKTDPVIKAQIAMEKDLQRQREISANAVKLGIATQDAASAQIEKVRQQHQAYIATLGNVSTATQKMAATTGLAKYELINLSRQAQDVGVSLFSGQSPFTVLVQQGTQIADVFANSEGTVKGFFSQAAAGARSLITPVTATIAAVVALTAAAAELALQYDKVQVSSRRAIGGAGERTGTTVSDLNQFTKQNSSPLRLSADEARALGEGLTSTGDIVISKLHGMGDAVVGFANQTGKSVSEAIKDFEKFGSDPKKAMEELSSVFGPVDEHVRNLVDLQSLATDKTAAFNTVLDAYADKLKEAADNSSLLEKASRFFSTAWGAPKGFKPTGTEDQLEDVRGRLNSAIEGAPSGNDTRSAAASADIERLSREFENLQQKREAAIGATAAAQLNALNTEAGRAAEQVAAIAKSWGDVSTATALALNALQQQAAIAGAVTTQQQMAAQYAADFANAALQGKTPLEAQAIAAAKLAVSEAAATSAVEKQTEALKDQDDMIKAHQNGTEATTAAAIAYKNAIESGASETSAAALAAQTLANYTDQAAANAAKFTAQIVSADAGLTSVMGRMQSMSWQQAQSLGQQTFTDSSGRTLTSPFDPVVMPSGDLSFQGDPSHPLYYNTAGAGKRLDTGYEVTAIQNLIAQQNDPTNLAATYVGRGDYAGAIRAVEKSTGSVDDRISQVDTLTQILNGQTTDKSVQAANLQAEMAWLQTLPETIARDQKIISLQQSIDQLKDSTDGLNSTMGDLLSPYYTQDPRTSHIGFRSQGMATGGELTVPGGYSANDNMIAQIPVASGEIVSVRRPWQDPGGKTASSPIVINMGGITIQGNANKDEVGRTLYQLGQTMAKQIAGAGQ